jgi:hypothetical protein
MGSINITVPGNIKLKYKLESNEAVEKIIQIIKDTSKKKITKNEPEENDIVGIWKDRFTENISSEIIQKELRTFKWIGSFS